MHLNQRTAMAAVSFALSTDAAADRSLASPIAIELHEVRGSQVTVAGERIAPGGRFALRPAGSQAVLRLEVDAGWVRVD